MALFTHFKHSLKNVFEILVLNGGHHDGGVDVVRRIFCQLDCGAAAFGCGMTIPNVHSCYLAPCLEDDIDKCEGCRC